MTALPATRPTWSYPNQHRFTKSQQRQVLDAVNSYAYQWGLIGVSPFHDVLRARRASHTDSGYSGWELVHAEINPARQLVPNLKDAKGGHFLPQWFQLRENGLRPIVETHDTRWSFRVGSVPLDYQHEIEPLVTRRGIAAISRWTWCRCCDAELACTRQGWCESCAMAPVSFSVDDVRPIGAPMGYVPEATL